MEIFSEEYIYGAFWESGLLGNSIIVYGHGLKIAVIMLRCKMDFDREEAQHTAVYIVSENYRIRTYPFIIDVTTFPW